MLNSVKPWNLRIFPSILRETHFCLEAWDIPSVTPISSKSQRGGFHSHGGTPMAGWFHGKSDRNMDDLEVPWIGNLREYSSNRQIAIFSHGTSMASINCDASKPHFLLKKCWLKSWKASCGHIADLSARRAVHCEAGQGQVTNQRGDQRSIKMGMGCNPFNANIYIYIYTYVYIYIYTYIYIHIYFFLVLGFTRF